MTSRRSTRRRACGWANPLAGLKNLTVPGICMTEVDGAAACWLGFRVPKDRLEIARGAGCDECAGSLAGYHHHAFRSGQ